MRGGRGQGTNSAGAQRVSLTFVRLTRRSATMNELWAYAAHGYVHLFSTVPTAQQQ